VNWIVFILTWLLPAQTGSECASFEIVDTLAIGVNPGHLSPDGLTFICGMEDEKGRELLYRWARRSLKARWKGPVPLAGGVNEIPDSVNNMQSTVSADGLRMVFVRNRTGTWGDNDLWMAERGSLKEPFDGVRKLTELNSDSTGESYPFICADGGHLYYTTDEGIMVAGFDERTARFYEPKLLKQPWGEDVLSCWLSADELTFVGLNYMGELLYAERTSPAASFEAIKTLDLSLQGIFLSSPSFSPNGELYLYASVSCYENSMEDDGVDVTVEAIGEAAVEEEVDQKTGATLNVILILNCKGGK
jgi:hypothetical protein